MNETSALQVYEAKDIKAYANRLLEAVPGTGKLQPGQAQALAEIALAHNLDPYNAEVWYIPGMGVSVGIKGYRKHARRQLREEGDKGSTFWTYFERVTDPTMYGEDEEAMVYICHLRDDVSLRAWGDSVKYFKDEIGLSDKLAVEAAGKAPVYMGLGVLGAKESSGRMPRVQRAQKRAEAHALKQRFDIQFSFADDDLMNPNVVEAEWEDEKPVLITDEIGASADQGIETLGYGRAPEKTWTKRQVEVVMESAPHIADKDRAISFLDKSGLSDHMEAYSQVTLKTIRTFSKSFQEQIDEDKNEKESFDYARANWQEVGKK